MSDTQAQFSVLRQTADPAVVDAISQLIAKGEDRELNRINLLDFSARNRARRREGDFGLPACGAARAVRSQLECAVSRLRRRARCATTLKSLRHDDYNCALCAPGYEASVDDQVEVAFTVSPRVRRIAAHDPNTLPIWEYNRQMFWSSGDGPERGIDHAADRRGFARGDRTAGGREGGAVAAIAEAIRDRVRAGDAFGAFSRCPGRADPRAPAVFHRLQQAACADRHHHDASRAVAAVARKSDRPPGAARGLDRQRHAPSSCSASASRS